MSGLDDSASTSLGSLSSLIDGAMSKQRTRWTCVAATTLYLYDIVITFDVEVDYIWRRLAFNFPTVLYFVNRYISLAFFLAASYELNPFRGRLPDAYCRAPLVYLGFMFAQNAWMAILTLRVCAIWKQNVLVTRLINVLWFLIVVSTIVVETLLYTLVGAKASYSLDTDLCLPELGSLPPVWYSAYSAFAPAVYETFLTVMTVVKGFNLGASVSWEMVPILYRVLARDGVAYFVLSAATAVGNAISWFYIADSEHFLIQYIYWALLSSVIARLVLGLRVAHSQGFKAQSIGTRTNPRRITTTGAAGTFVYADPTRPAPHRLSLDWEMVGEEKVHRQRGEGEVWNVEGVSSLPMRPLDRPPTGRLR